MLIQRCKGLDVLIRKHALTDEALPGCCRMALSDHPLKHGEVGRLVRFLTLCQRVDERLKRLRQKLERVAEHHVPAPLDLEIPFHVLADRLDRSTGVRNHLLDDQVSIVAAQVVEEHWHVVDDFALPVAEVVCGTDVVAGYVVRVVHLEPVGVLAIERAVGPAADAANGRFEVAVTLRLRQISHRPVRLQVLDALGLPLDELIKELPERVFAGEQAKLAVHLCHFRRADYRGRSTTPVLLVKMRLAVRDVHLREHRLQVRVYYEGCHGNELPVRKLE